MYTSPLLELGCSLCQPYSTQSSTQKRDIQIDVPLGHVWRVGTEKEEAADISEKRAWSGPVPPVRAREPKYVVVSRLVSKLILSAAVDNMVRLGLSPKSI